jgi:hypothetical protein
MAGRTVAGLNYQRPCASWCDRGAAKKSTFDPGSFATPALPPLIVLPQALDRCGDHGPPTSRAALARAGGCRGGRTGRPEPNALDNALGPAVSNELHNDDFETVGHSSAENLPPPVFVRVLSMNGLERRLIFRISLPREMTQWSIRLYPHH